MLTSVYKSEILDGILSDLLTNTHCTLYIRIFTIKHLMLFP